MEIVKIGEGKTKEVYEFREGEVLLKFKDTVTAGDGAKKDVISGKGVLNAQTSAILFRFLEGKGVRTHYIGMRSEDTMIARKLQMIPIEVVVRFIAVGSIVKRLPFQEGQSFKRPIVEFFLKDDLRHDPLLNYYHMEELSLMSREEAVQAEGITERVGLELSSFFKERGLCLYDLKLEFGRYRNTLVVGDELSLDSMRVRECNTGRIMDKDLYRKGADLGTVKASYEEFLRRISQ